uniref:IgGFc-binding protein-like n=1 Tax=Lepisosteus oculatus TaxID=7918 RepID=W5M7M8_LEPOC
MGTTHLLPGLATLLLSGICWATPGGKEFATVFMQNYEQNYGNPRMQIQVSAFHPDTKVKVSVAKLGYIQERTLGAGQGVTFQLPNSVEVYGSQKTSNTVLIEASKDVTVVSLNYKYLTADTAVIYPVTDWGTEYYIFTSPISPLGTYKELAVANYKEPNSIDVYLRAPVRFQGQLYFPGTKLTINLGPFESVQLQSWYDLSGSRVVSKLPVAVFSGHSCTWRFTRCNHVYEQLTPVSRWGRSFIVPPLSFQNRFDSVYIQASQPTQVTVQAGNAKETVDLNRGDIYEFQIRAPFPLSVTSNQGIQVLFQANGAYFEDGTMFDPFLMTIVPTDRFCTAYTLDGQADFKNVAIFLVRTNDLPGLKFDGNPVTRDVPWRAIAGTQYSWGEVAFPAGAGRHTAAHPSSPFGLYSVGIAQMNGYGAPAPCSQQALCRPPVAMDCSSVTCSTGEQCVMSGGFPSCVQQSVKTGTCSAMGDPHYRTFDGRTFDFMGTCTYIITKNCRSDDGLPAFEVEAKNENRGSMSVSYVAMVTVKVYGYAITVVRSEIGLVRVNYRIGYVPMILDNGKLTISQSGRSVIINTDFGLTVRYDWEHYLVVTVPGSLAGKLCGLCGNFNGRQDDDFATPSGSQAPDAVALGRSWRASGAAGDGLCWDDCNGQCRRCEHSFIKRWEGELFCGLLTRIVDGPFRLCHSVIDPKIYLDNCVFDVCMADGYHHYLCRVLEVYAEVCQRAGIVVYDWRTLAKCPARCPENSHYELCGSACPATCGSPDAPSKCSAPCVETCTCNPGFVLSRGRCVPQARCGCTYEGRHIPAGETVWADDSCRRRCYCNPASSTVECREEGCRSGEQCQVVDGVRGCYPVTYSTCTAAGDPHYLTFDGHRYNFQGTCVYQLVGVCSKNPSLVPFEVLVQNNFRGNRVVSYTKLVEVKVYGMSIIISREFQGLIEVNNELTNLPAFLDGGKVVVYRSGWFAVVKTNFGLQVAFDWNSVVTVTLPSTYAGAVCGLCGNYNNKQQDDLQMKNGRLASSASEFGQSWQVVDIPGCVHGCKGICPDCDVNQKQQYETDKFCGLLRDPKGPFRDCHAKVDPSGYFQDCVYDVCLYKGSKTVLCQAITSYTAACQEKGAKVYPWRSEKFCDAKCPANSHYEVCASGCPATCYSLAPPAGCQALCKEGCACSDGFILSGDQCVPLAGCGCLYSGRYYKTGQVFYPDGRCQSECRCQPDGRVECAKFSCGPHEECKLEDGVRKCHAVGEGTCSASGDPHYVSFDGKRFDFQGTCTYTLAKACGLEGTRLAPFSVDVENEKWGNGKVAVTKLVAVEIDGNTLILKAGVKGQIMVNGVWNNLPISLNNHAVRAFQHGINVIIDTSFGLRVTYDLVYHVTVRVPGSYRDKMCGLCGNFNGNQKDDFLLPSGQLTPDIKAFGSAWKVAVPGVLCDDACSGNTCPVCEAKRQAVFEKRGYCGILTEPNGPFAQCYAKVHPDVYFSNCIYDLCMSEGDINVLCNSIAAYVTACQSFGVDIKSWRTPSFCPLSCAANSHYEICADSCSVACAGLSDITKCPTTCAEGCACDAGFFFDGEGCVPMDQCGCYDHGRYYKPGEVVYEDECQQKCTCNAIDGLVCEAHSCPAGTQCLIRNGIKACFNTDPCKDANCRVKETCRVEKGQAVCVPQYTGTCWAWGDPHYHTFDGYNYDFQGTCTYIISKTCGKNAAGLVPFSIEEQNDNRGSTVVSYVREVVVFVYGYKVTMLKQQYGRVMVNDELVNLPVIIDGGQLNVYQSGIMAVLQTDFGLTVSYDWNWHLVIQLPSSYYDSVCGLCGNFDGNGNDEMRTPDGTAVSSVIDWAKAWRVQDKQDAFCWDSCQKDCPTCDGNVVKLYETEAYCGALTKKVDGLFQQCHVKVDPRAFMDSCVYDMCQNQGDKKMLCQALTSYANMCRREGIILKDWRKQTGCPMNCQPLSHYEPCASPCPVSCPYPDSRPTCNGTCVETCECDPGFVLSAGKCVLASTCGCSYQGRHYRPYERFWADEGCHKLCECDPALRMVVCKEASCKASEECSLVDGVRGCHPLTYSTCMAAGDPHYYSFDGHDFTFQGTCIYQFVGLCSKDPSLVPFKVNVQNNHRGSRTVAYTKVVAIEVFNLTIVISINYPNKVLVNGELISLPFYYDDNKVVMYKSGAWAVVQTDFGMKVQFDWSNVVTVTLPSTYKGAVCGLCGNYNNNPADDSKMPDGRSAPNVQTFGDSWKVGEVPGCSSDCSGPWCKVCSDSQKDVYRAERYCGAIVNKNGPFRQCHARIDPARFMESCVYDACHYKGRPSVVCDAVAAYAAACQDARVPIQPWRSSSFCPATCPRNSHYELCATGCPATCHGLSAPEGCRQPCREGCHCDNGFLLSGEECVPLAECGCAYGGRYYRKCQVFYPKGHCNERCKCGENGAVSCTKFSCGAQEECKVVDGVRGCYPVGEGSCVAYGDPHYVSFDGHRFNFQGTCTYTLAKSCDSSGQLVGFAVEQENVKYGNQNVAVTMTVAVIVYDYVIAMSEGMRWFVLVNDVRYNLPLFLDGGKITVNQQGGNIVLRTDFGLQVFYDSMFYVRVTVPSTYRGKMCGLCGNYNSDGKDDLLLPSGAPAASVDAFGKAWRVGMGGGAGQCSEGCGDRCHVCEQANEALYGQEDACGLIRSTHGPFQACHGKVDPELYFQQCVFDVCALNGDKGTLCKTIQAYVAACQLAGADVKPWRTKTFCPATCPANSHYELCADTCSSACAGLVSRTPCSSRCFEGCECDQGFMADGDRCVSVEACGCVYDGAYLQVGQSVVTKGCSQKCTCQPTGGVVCEKMQCASGEQCSVREGVRGCHKQDPCAAVKCREKEECRAGVCKHISKATCEAVGDPHYTTFDGRKFDFQGTCSYTLSATRGDAGGLEQFAVTAKNENRGNTKVSFVRTVTITVYGQTISISKYDSGKVGVNGISSNLPVTLVNGKLRVARSGRYALLTTDFELQVMYDWNMALFITVPSSYFRLLGGLCGNYNGDRGDEFSNPRGELVTAVLDFASSWKVEDKDLFCHHHCNGECPSCSLTLQEKYRGEDFCGLMAKKDGPFAGCHATLNPEKYVDNCVYDVCINKGYRKFLCEALESYADACRREGAKLTGSWRTLASCPLDCPENSHYEACGSACPASCGDLDAPARCQLPCAETCVCDSGFVLSGSSCVQKGACGCSHEGQYYTPGQEFWADERCGRRCTCQARTGTVACVSAGCKSSEVCDLRDGVRGCYPASFATCEASGDPHYRSFDGKTFDFQGTCTYQMAKLCGSAAGLVPFEVHLQNENRGQNKAVAFTKMVRILVYGHEIIMSKDSPGRVMFNQLYVNLPFYLEDNKLSIYRSGFAGVVRTSFGMTVSFNWNSYFSVTLPSTYSGAVCGLCGNWNGNRGDDMLMPDRSPASTPTAFGHSWKVKDDPGCSSDCKGGVCPSCDPGQRRAYEGADFCGRITDRSGPFKDCHAKVEPQLYFDNCVFDVCLYRGHSSALCEALTAYTTACQSAGATVALWRSDRLCPVACKENSHYSVCAAGCPLTCRDLSSAQTCAGTPCREGCECDDGFLLSDGRCVPVADCGCVHEGRYYKAGEVFFPWGLCSNRCVCQQGGAAACDEAAACGPNEKCVLKDGVQGCHPAGTGTCWIAGNTRYRSFDGRGFSLFGNCVYRVAEAVGKDGKLAPFLVTVHQESALGVTVTRSVAIRAYGYELTLLPGLSWEVRVGGVRANLPLSLEDGRVSAYQSGIHIIAETDFGLKVSYDGASSVVFNVPSTYKGALGGLCGNYNDNKADDFALPGGTQAGSVDAFAAGWVPAEEQPKCVTGCGTDCPGTDDKKKPEAEKETACGMLRSAKGPFAGCQAAVPPAEYFDDCVQEVITEGGNQDILCRHIQKYAAACQAAGGSIGIWRSDKFCPLKCPANSHYELCADTCAATCASLSQAVRCPRCQEGCQCDEGFVFTAGACVPLESCGCMVEGRYYKSGEAVLQKACSELCTCKAGVLSCSRADCASDEACEVRNGVMGCYSKDPCQNTKCRQKEDCIVRDTQAVCIAQSKATCWAMGDPHYQSFDGKPFSFQGTCSYILARTTGRDPTLTPFSILNKNEVRGNADGSFVKLVTVQVKGHEIAILRGERGRVRVDGISSNLPVSLESGSIRIVQSGIRAVLETDFGLEVVFDWTTLFMVTVSSSYYDNLEGLCGNYNADTGDDHMAATGVLVANVTEWARSWSLPDRDPFCWHYCQGSCPTCADADQELYRGQRFCGLIEDKSGPFAQCHGALKPQLFADNCLYDVCLNRGRQEVYCQALANYVSACRAAGASVSAKWRELAKCPLNCPQNSHYEFCGSPCPATCAEPKPRSPCPLACTESCQCDEGFVLSGDRCVSAKTGCGCTHGERYYLPGEAFWADARCQQQCACDGATQTVSCRPRGCKASEQCKVVDGVQDCYPLSYQTCTALGDPHFRSFDGRRFDFQGTCVYRLAGVCSKDPSLPAFDVTLENNNRGSRLVSFARVVSAKVLDRTVTISQDYRGRILVDGILTSLPFYFNGSQASVYRSGAFAVLETHFGLKVQFDWSSAVSVTVPSTYAGATCGLCGNNNGNLGDDLLLPGGQAAQSPTHFGNSQRVGDTPGCSPECRDCPEPPPKPGPGEKPPAYLTDCDVIRSASGLLRDCLARVDSAHYHESCVFDLRLHQGLQRAACDVIAAYVKECQDAGGKIEPWRRSDFCAPSCPRNSEYTTCGPGCPATCADMAAPRGCAEGCREGCQCQPGFLLSDGECVPLQDCGCAHESRYYPSGATFYPRGDCTQRCSCLAGAVSCSAASCGPQETCKVLAGVQACHPRSYASCAVSGNSHYLTFDGVRYDFQGACGYTLAQVSGSAAAGLARFSVQLQKERAGAGGLAVPRSVAVSVYEVSVALEKSLPWQIRVSGSVVPLPRPAGGKLRVSQVGKGIVLQADFGLTVTYDLQQTVSVTVPSTYSGQLVGACGNYNGRVDDEFALPSGAPAGSASEFGVAWRLEGDQELCGDGCLAGGCPKPVDKDKEALKKPDKCGLISSPQGPLAACHSVLSPAGFVENCVSDSFAAEGKMEAVCLGIQAYVTACQEAGVTLKNWRSNSFCPFSCPAKSHYALCADTCGSSCPAVTGPLTCAQTCAEGCECDAGFVADGNKCVAVQDCGCDLVGMYLKVGRLEPENDCTQRCSCDARHDAVCETHSCPADTQCGVRNGALGCYPTHATCTLSQGSVGSFDGANSTLKIGGHFDVAVHPASQLSSVGRFRVVAGVRVCGQDQPTLGVVFGFFGETLVTVSSKQKVWVS